MTKKGAVRSGVASTGKPDLGRRHCTYTSYEVRSTNLRHQAIRLSCWRCATPGPRRWERYPLYQACTLISSPSPALRLPRWPRYEVGIDTSYTDLCHWTAPTARAKFPARSLQLQICATRHPHKILLHLINPRPTLPLVNWTRRSPSLTHSVYFSLFLDSGWSLDD